MTTPALPRLRTVLLTALVVGSLGMLSGCAPEAGPTGPSDGPSVSAEPTTTPTGTLPPTEQPDLGEPGPECEEILSPADVYAFNPNYSAVAAPAPEDGSLLSQAAALDGTTCRWVNNSSGVSFDAAVTVPGETELAELLSAAESDATAAPEISDPPAVVAFFDQDGDVGTAQIFTDGRWILLSGVPFGEARDLEELTATVVANLSAQ